MSLSLMDRMIAAGVDIHNFQEVFDFYHSHTGESGGGGNGEGLTYNEVLALFNQWGLGKLNTVDFEAALLDLARNSDILRLERDLATKVELTQGLNQKAEQSEITRIEQAISQGLAGKASTASVSQLDAAKANKTDVDLALSEKLDRGEIQQHFKGVFSSITALENGVTNPQAGDYAHVDAGVGENAKIHIWDATDAKWIEQGSSGISVSSTDDVIEGNINQYFTPQRARQAMQGVSTDTLTEGSNNQFFTPQRARQAMQGVSTDTLTEGTNKFYTDQRVLSVINPLLGDIETILDDILGGTP